MVDFLHYGMRKPASVNDPIVTKTESVQEEVKPEVVLAETTAPVLEEEQIVINEEDTVQEVVEKVKKSKKLHAKVSENGQKVRVKRVLKD